MFNRDLLSRLTEGQEKWIADYRMKKYNDFSELPMPTWKRIGLKDLSLPGFREYNNSFLDFDGHGSEDIVVRDILTGLKSHDEIESYIDLEADFGVDNKLVAFGESFYNSGVLIHAGKKAKSKLPIRLYYEIYKNNPMVLDHNIIIAEEDSEITVVIDYNSSDDYSVFHNGVTKIFVKDRATVNIIKVQRLNNSSYHFDSNIAIVESRGKINWITVELGSKITSSSFVTNLNADNSEATLNSIYFGDEDRKLDLDYTMNHLGVRTNSTIDSRGALKDNAKKVFRGNLDFKRGSSKSKGSEKEYVTLLDSTVRSDSIPVLFCGEDDVEGEHAASAGQISEDKLMYIMSRGLSEKEAKRLIVAASFEPVINKISVKSVKDSINNHILKRLSYD